MKRCRLSLVTSSSEVEYSPASAASGGDWEGPYFGRPLVIRVGEPVRRNAVSFYQPGLEQPLPSRPESLAIWIPLPLRVGYVVTRAGLAGQLRLPPNFRWRQISSIELAEAALPASCCQSRSALTMLLDPMLDWGSLDYVHVGRYQSYLHPVSPEQAFSFPLLANYDHNLRSMAAGAELHPLGAVVWRTFDHHFGLTDGHLSSTLLLGDAAGHPAGWSSTPIGFPRKKISYTLLEDGRFEERFFERGKERGWPHHLFENDHFPYWEATFDALFAGFDRAGFQLRPDRFQPQL